MMSELILGVTHGHGTMEEAPELAWRLQVNPWMRARSVNGYGIWLGVRILRSRRRWK